MSGVLSSARASHRVGRCVRVPMRCVTGSLGGRALGSRTHPLGCIYALVAADKERHRALPGPQANLLAIFACSTLPRRSRTGDKICMKLATLALHCFDRNDDLRPRVAAISSSYSSPPNLRRAFGNVIWNAMFYRTKRFAVRY